MSNNQTAFDPKQTKYPYPEYTDEHYIVIKKNNGVVVDENYPFIDKSKSFVFQDKLLTFLLYFIVYFVNLIYTGLRVKGRENLKENKELLKNGFISVSNHIHMWDFICVRYALRQFKPRVIVWNKNVIGENTWNIRHIGGIPIPVNNIKASIKFSKAIIDHLNDKGTLHIYSEGSMWHFYKPIRPFKTGASHLAIKTDKPIIPMAFSFRKPSFIRKYILRQPAALTLTIGKPIMPNDNFENSVKDISLGHEKDLTIKMHDEVCRLANIEPSENIYPPIFNKTKRIDY